MNNGAAFVAKVLGTVLIGCMASLASAKDMVLAEVHPDGHVIVTAETLFAKRFAELTHGEIKVDLKTGGQLGSETQSWAKVRDGSVDIVRINCAELAKDVKSIQFLSLPYLFRSREHMWRVLDGDFGKRADAEVEKNGAIVLAYYDSGTRSFYTSKKPIRSRADFKGLTIRIQNSPVYKDLITELGATPVVIGYNDVTEAFKTGKIDGAENNFVSYMESGHYKYAKYYSMDEHSAVPEVLLMSKKTWDKLSAPQRKAAQDAARESAELMKKLWADAETAAAAKVKKEGAVIIEKSQMNFTGIEEFAVRLYSKYIQDAGDLNLVLGIMRTK